MRTLLVVLLALVVSHTDAGEAATYYVDSDIGDNGSEDPEDPATPLETIAFANTLVSAGDAIMIKGSSDPGFPPYYEPIVPTTPDVTYEGWGTARPQIVHQSNAAFTAAQNRCIWLKNDDYVVVKNIECNGETSAFSGGYVLFQTSDYNEIRDCAFIGGRSGIGIQSGEYNRIIDNLVDPDLGPAPSGLDVITFSTDAKRNLFEGNEVTDGEHGTLRIQGSMNVVRNNRLSNPNGRVFEIVHELALGHPPADRNVVDGNEMTGSAVLGQTGTVNVFQLWASRNLVRRNLIHANGGTGIKLTRKTSGPVLPVEDNRIVHNVFYANGQDPDNGIQFDLAGFHLQSANGTLSMEGNVLANNVIQDNNQTSDVQILIDGQPLQSGTGTQETVIRSNAIVDTGSARIFIEDPPDYCEDQVTTPPQSPATIADYESCFPSLVSGNLGTAPLFVDAANGDFRPQAGSATRDAGAFLTTTVLAGTDQTDIPVEDAGYFFDGFGIPGVDGDTIRVGIEVRVVTAVDYANHILTVDAPTTFAQGATVTLGYLGSSPDIGAFEYSECNDGVDNDNDGDVDWDGGSPSGSADPACPDPYREDEGPACDDDVDNDGDNKIDWDGGPGGGTKDGDCLNKPWGYSEGGSSCGLGFELAPLCAGLLWLRSARRRRTIVERG